MTATPAHDDVDDAHNVDDVLAALRRLDRQSEAWATDTLQLIHRYPGVHTAALARRSGLRPSELNSRLRRLRDLGLVEQSESLGHRLTPLGDQLIRATN